ncbi:MAG TPA: hypothetical protein VGM67_19520 [Gemmatimonadaceae bacterium]|jgi:hypothetical protein
MVKVHTLTIRNRAAAVVFGVGVLALGALLLTMGFALLLGIGIAGTLVGGGVAVYRRLRGTSGAQPRMSHIGFGRLTDFAPHAQSGELRLDPTREVKPVVKAIVRPLDEND